MASGNPLLSRIVPGIWVLLVSAGICLGADAVIGGPLAGDPAMPELIRLYRESNVDRRRAILQTVANKGIDAYPLLAALALAETDNDARVHLFAQAARTAWPKLPELLKAGRGDLAEAILLVGIAASREDSATLYALVMALLGRVDAQLAEAQARWKASGSTVDAVILAMLFRAKGDLAQARHWAEQSKIPAILDQILAERGEWKELVGRLARDLQSKQPHYLAYLAGCQWAARDEDGLQQTLALLRHEVLGYQSIGLAANALLATDRVREAAEVLRESGHFSQSLGLLWSRGQDDAVFARAEAIVAADSTMRKTVGRYLRPPPQPELPATRKTIGRPPLTSRRAAESSAWRALFTLQYPKESDAQRARRTQQVLDDALPVPQLEAIATEVLALDASEKALAGHGRGLAATFCRPDRPGGNGVTILCRLAGRTRKPADFQVALECAISRQEWAAAALAARDAVRDEAMSVVVRALAAQAFLGAGQGDAGREQQRRTMLALLHDEPAQLELPLALDRAGLKEPARVLREVLVRAASHGSYTMVRLMEPLAMDAFRQGDYASAASLFERLRVFSLYEPWTEPWTAQQLRFGAYLHASHALMLFRDGQAPAARKRLEQAMACHDVHDSELIIQLVPALRRLKQDQLAQKVLQDFRAILEHRLEAYPRSALVHNAIAWTLAGCRVELDAALENATKAVEFVPAHVPYLGTLAEVHFQRGERGKAIEAIEKAIRLDPNDKRLYEALERFKNGTPDSLPPI